MANSESKNSKSTFLYILRITLPLFIICSVTAATVSLVYALTYEPALKNMQSVEEDAIHDIFGDGITISAAAKIDGGSCEIREIGSGGDTVGYSVKSTASGFGGDIEVIIGYNANLSIKKISIVSHSETPGLGDRISGDYKDAYIGKYGKLVLGEDIDAIVGSTISSRALLTAVNNATDELEIYRKESTAA